MATKTKSTNKTSSSAAMMLAYAVIISLISSLILSADAIRCHQCNSHSHEDCANLLVNTPRQPRDNQFLTECVGENADIAFCRKTVITFDVNHEKRIERSCGWIKESHNNACFTADNEGYQQVICTCSGDGCNSAPIHFNRGAIFATTGVSFLLANWLRR